MLPDSLQRNLKRFEKKLFFTESTVFICGGLLGLLLSFMMLFISDRFWDTPVAVRLAVTSAGCLISGFAAVWWSRIWLLKRRDERALARMVQAGIGGIGDRLLGAVELAEGRNVPDHISPALCRAAIEQVASQMESYDFRKAVRASKSRYLLAGALLCGAVVAAIAVLVPSAFWNSLARWGKPAADVPRFTFVSVEHLPDHIVVPYGEPYEISIRLSSSSLWRPSTAKCRYDEQGEVDAVIKNGTAVFMLPGCVEEGTLFIRTGDIKRSLSVIPVFRPELVELKAFIRLPGYLGYPDVEKRVESGACEVLEGSQISLSGVVSRELQSAEMRTDERTGSVTAESNVFRIGYQDSSAVSNIVLTWKDVHGLEPLKPYSVRFFETKDNAPAAECRGVARSVAVLEDEVLNIQAFAGDDYGLRDMRLRWSVKDRDSQTGTEEVLLSEGGRQVRELNGEYKFSPLANGIPEESVVTLFAAASDYRPGAAAELSAAHRIYVLSKATHTKLVQDLMERVQNRIEDLIHDEQSLMKDNEKLLALDKDSLVSGEGTEETRRNEYREREQARKLEDILQAMRDIMKETMRNSEIDSAAAEDWAALMQKLGELSQQEMKVAVSSMSKAAGGEKAERSGNLAKSVEIEKSIVAKLKESAGSMGRTIEDMFARNFVNRLRLLSQWQADVGVTAKTILPKSIGLSREDLPEAVENLIAGQEGLQSRISVEAGYIYDDLGGYYNRTRRAVFDVIRKDMVTKKMSESLAELKQHITVNLGVSVIDSSAVWSARFKEWAEWLAEDSGEKDPAEGEEAELSEQDLEVLIELIRLRYGEETLREQTRMLEERKPGNVNYGADARKLARKQKELDETVVRLQRKVRHKKIKGLLEKIDGEMLNVEVYLKRPQTDSETVAIQTEIIELLSGAMSESSSGKQGGLAAMLMQMMGMGGAGGGSYAGGTTDLENMSFEKDPSSQPFDAGAAETTGGADDEQWPAEFRDLLEAYHRALEEK